MLADSVSGEGPLAHGPLSFTSTSHGRRGEVSISDLLFKSTGTIHEGSDSDLSPTKDPYPNAINLGVNISMYKF
jgi:hypothetical protein